MKQTSAVRFTLAIAAAGALMAAVSTSMAKGEAGVVAGDAGSYGKPHAAGMTAYTIRSGGRERHYLLFVPRRYDGATAMPAVVDFHGSGSNPEEELMVTGMARAAEERGFLIVMPVANVEFPLGGYTWNVPVNPELPDDVGFVRDVLDDVAKKVRLDASRVYASGFSGGARLASQLACELADRIAAVGAVGGLRSPADCRASRPVPVVAFHGTEDPINPYAGGGPDYWGAGVDEALRAWAMRNNRASSRVKERVSASVTRISYPSRDGAADVVLYRIDGAGHVWPGSTFPFPAERFGAMNGEIDATETMLDFFERRSLS